MVRRIFMTVAVILSAVPLLAAGEESVAELAIRVKKIQAFVLELKADHEARISHLEAESTLLREQLGKAKAEIRRKDALIETAKEAGFGNRTHFVSALHILSTLPDELQPDADPGWDGFTLPKVAAWLKKVPTGEPFKATLKVYDSTVTKNFGAPSTTAKPPFKVSIRFYSETVKFKNQPFVQYVAPYENGRFDVNGDEEFARKAGDIKQGDLFEVSGRIRQVDLKTFTSSGPRKCWILLNDYKLTPIAKKE